MQDRTDSLKFERLVFLGEVLSILSFGLVYTHRGYKLETRLYMGQDVYMCFTFSGVGFCDYGQPVDRRSCQL